MVTLVLKTLTPLLFYEMFILHTEHTALNWFLTIDEPNGHMMRWRLCLAEYEFDVLYKEVRVTHRLMNS